MDVSGWTLAQRMELPDWCFPNRRILGVYKANVVPTTFTWEISDTDFPDPCCIWEVAIFTQMTAGASGLLRFGMAHNVPVNVVQMDAAEEIFPDCFKPHVGPNELPMRGATYTLWRMYVRQGIVTSGKNLVIQIYCAAGECRCDVTFLVSGLPTRIPAHLDPNTI